MRLYSPRQTEFVRKHADLVRWYVEHAPENSFSSSPHVFWPTWSKEDSAKVQHAWSKQIEKYPDNANVLHGAARFLTLIDFAKADELAHRAHSLAPDNTEISVTLAHLLELKMHRSEAEERVQLASEALQLNELVMSAVPTEKSGHELTGAAKNALEIGDCAKAQKYAEELLQLSHGEYWDASGAFHQAQLILGRIALRKGDLVEAKTRLLEAARMPETPFQLTTFGPNMALAKELLERGEKDIVLQYFDKCERFWHQKEMLDNWRESVRRDEIPNFSGNLLY